MVSPAGRDEAVEAEWIDLWGAGSLSTWGNEMTKRVSKRKWNSSLNDDCEVEPWVSCAVLQWCHRHQLSLQPVRVRPASASNSNTWVKSTADRNTSSGIALLLGFRSLYTVHNPTRGSTRGGKIHMSRNPRHRNWKMQRMPRQWPPIDRKSVV